MKTENFDKNPWDWTKARHLLNRAGFGGKPSEIELLDKIGLDSGLKKLFDFKSQSLETPDWLSEYDRFSLRGIRDLSEEERRELNRLNRQRIHEFQVGWIKRMIESPKPSDMLWEKMTFFWHGHFATGVQKVRMPPLLFTQLGLFHENAVGSFKDLLHGISRDPAMLRYLDNNQNRRGKPNENFARELMELFSLGPGNYTETDVKEAARAFTGWTNDPFNFRIRFRQHDHGKKTFLGHTGNFNGEDIVNIILDQPACAEFIARKILNFFSFGNISGEKVQTFADEFRSHDYQIEPLLKKIFSHKDFYAAKVIGTQIKSPIQLMVGTARTLDLKINNDEFVLYTLNLMGQVPYFPPNVKGWPGGKSWIDTSRLLTRYTFAEIIGRGEIPREIDPRSSRDFGPRKKKDRKRAKGAFGRNMRDRDFTIEFDPGKLLSGQNSPDAILKRLTDVLLAQNLTDDERQMLLTNYKNNLNTMNRKQAQKNLIGDIMGLPAYQLC